MKVWKIALVSVLALGLVLGMTSPALAAPPWVSPPSASPSPPRVIKGEVASIAADSFVVRDGWCEVRVSVNSDTEYFRAVVTRRCGPFAPHLLEPPEPCPRNLGLMERFHRLAGRALAPLKVPALVRNRLELQAAELPPPCGEEATFDDIEVGSRVVVWAVPGEDDPLARRVVIIEPAACRQVLGTIIIADTAGKTITVAPADGGDDVILSYGDGTRFVLRGSISLEVGEQVRAVYDEEGMAKLVIVVGEDLD